MRGSPLAVSLLLIASAFGQSQSNAQPPQNPPQKPQPHIMTWIPPDQPSPPFGSVIRKTVLVVRETCKDKDGTVWDSSGTGFIVAYHDPRLASADLVFQYLVTNRHVAECFDQDLQPREVLSIRIEANMKNGQTSTMPLNDHGNARWYLPTDASIDLAVTPILPGGDFVPTVLPLDEFFSKEDFAAQNMGEGSKIILSGYFASSTVPPSSSRLSGRASSP